MDDEAIIVDESLEEVVATGNWCTRCEYLEDPDDVSDGRCMSCGCPEGDHTSVKVVTA